MLRAWVLLFVFTFIAQCGLFHFWPVITRLSLACSLLFAVAFIGATNFIWKVNVDDLLTAAKEEGSNEQLHRNDGDDWW